MSEHKRLTTEEPAGNKQKRWVTEVIAENVRFLDKREAVSETNNTGTGSFGTEVFFNQDDIPF